MDSIIKNSLKNSMSYAEYRNLVKQLVVDNSTTGDDKSEAMVDYTKLNDRRMNRWDKTIKISENAKKRIESFEENMTWLLLTESWCGDAAHVVPAINKVAELNDHIDLRIVLRDDNPDLMNAFLTNGGRAIPKLIIVENATGNVVNTFGPRPTEATNYVNRFKAKYGTLTPEFKEDLQHWYNNDKGQNVINDLTELLCELQPTVCQ
ncbi:thioredoxin family protein [Hwangdonia lutea]|uniref:Thioredoxin family protein n=1 Tax=Hwangdonia lutea TaxID=3075823 RepID=A0AA97HRF2_9FLAO|nr:thioredoxin family protein [Hwangdonia sp. SCSIO 19198]WOD44851.1 thioredoxin family protein [Hwangdonia sp. SCSIO 19198]